MLNTEFLSLLDEASRSAPSDLQQTVQTELKRIRSFLAQYAAENRMHFSERRTILAGAIYCLEKIDKAAIAAKHLPLCNAVKAAHDELRRFVPGVPPLGAVAA